MSVFPIDIWSIIADNCQRNDLLKLAIACKRLRRMCLPLIARSIKTYLGFISSQIPYT